MVFLNNYKFFICVTSLILGKYKLTYLLILSRDIDAGVRKVDDTILNELQQKQPQSAPLTSDTLLNGPVNLDETMVFKSASMTKGAGGPS